VSSAYLIRLLTVRSCLQCVLSNAMRSFNEESQELSLMRGIIIQCIRPGVRRSAEPRRRAITPQPNPRSRRTHLSARVPPPLPPNRAASRVTARIVAPASVPGARICRGHRDCQEARRTRCFQEAQERGPGAHSRRCAAAGRVGRRSRRDGTDDARQCGGAVGRGDRHEKTERRAVAR